MTDLLGILFTSIIVWILIKVFDNKINFWYNDKKVQQTKQDFN